MFRNKIKNNDRKARKTAFLELLSKNWFWLVAWDLDYAEHYLNEKTNHQIFKEHDEENQFTSCYKFQFENWASRSFNWKEELIGFLILKWFLKT